MPKISDLAEQLWTGELSPRQHHPWAPTQEIEELDGGLAFLSSFANVIALQNDAGLVLIDTGSSVLAGLVHEQLRTWTRRPLHTAVYTHGHIDHVFGVPLFDEEARANHVPAPRVIAHEALPARFDRYRRTAGLNGLINTRQFQLQGFTWPTNYRYPDVTYRERMDLDIGGEHLELHHARGETDDHTWVWMPQRHVLCTGDFFI